MKPFNVLLKKNYAQKIRSKTFIITTSLYLLIVLAVAFWGDIKDLFTGGEDSAQEVIVYNETSTEMDNYFADNEAMVFEFSDDRESVVKSVEDATTDVGLVLKESDGQLATELISQEPLPLKEQEGLDSLISMLTQYYAFESMNLSAEQQEKLLTVQPIMETTVLSEQESKSADEKYAGILGSYAVGILIYFFVISYLSIITTDVASEKGSRALEMLLVSVKPEVHFRAKVLSVFLAALSQFIIVIGIGLAVLKLKDGGKYWTMAAEFLNDLSPMFIVFVGGFLLFTVLMYLIIGALFGSLVSKVEESSQVMTPAMIIIVVAFYIMIAAMNNPDTILIKVFSYVPFTSGMIMPMRIGGTDMSLIEPVISLVVLIATVLGLYMISTSFYKRSVLTYTSGGIIQKIKTVLKVTT